MLAGSMALGDGEALLYNGPYDEALPGFGTGISVAVRAGQCRMQL